MGNSHSIGISGEVYPAPIFIGRCADVRGGVLTSKRIPECLRRQPQIFLAVHESDLDAAARKGHTSEEYAKAVKEANASDEHPLHKFYKTQSLQYLERKLTVSLCPFGLLVTTTVLLILRMLHPPGSNTFSEPLATSTRRSRDSIFTPSPRSRKR